MMGFFNVVTDIKIGGKLHVPCISYAVTPNNEATILKLVKEGKAEITVEEAVFQSGKKVEKEKKKAKKVDISFVREKIKEEKIKDEKVKEEQVKNEKIKENKDKDKDKDKGKDEKIKEYKF